MAGVVMPRLPDVQTGMSERMATLTLTMLLPVFFVVVGLSTRIDMLDDAYLWSLAALVVVVAVAGKWGGSMLAARFAGETWRDANTIGVLMNTRGLTELVILRVGLELGVMNTTVFTIMVLMALVTTLMATPMLRLFAYREVGHDEYPYIEPKGGRRVQSSLLATDAGLAASDSAYWDDRPLDPAAEHEASPAVAEAGVVLTDATELADPTVHGLGPFVRDAGGVEGEESQTSSLGVVRDSESGPYF